MTRGKKIWAASLHLDSVPFFLGVDQFEAFPQQTPCTVTLAQGQMTATAIRLHHHWFASFVGQVDSSRQRVAVTGQYKSLSLLLSVFLPNVRPTLQGQAYKLLTKLQQWQKIVRNPNIKNIINQMSF